MALINGKALAILLLSPNFQVARRTGSGRYRTSSVKQWKQTRLQVRRYRCPPKSPQVSHYCVQSFLYKVSQVIHLPVLILRMPRSAFLACVCMALYWSMEPTSCLVRLLTSRKSASVRKSSCGKTSCSISRGRVSRTPTFVLGDRKRLVGGGEGSLSSRA